jgi:hypothetical protein
MIQEGVSEKYSLGRKGTVWKLCGVYLFSNTTCFSKIKVHLGRT